MMGTAPLTNLTEVMRLVERMLREAGEHLKAAHRQPRAVTFKGDVNLVTQTDFALEALLVGQLHERFPDHAILAEEGTDFKGQPGYRWVVDPLDGTNNFAHGFPVFCITMALLDEAGPLIAGTFDPLRDEMFTAVRGEGAHLNGQRIAVSAVGELRHGLLSTGFPYNRHEVDADDNTDMVKLFIKRAQGLRRAGSAALDAAYVACGRLDGHWELGLRPWDVAAGILLVREAGGRVSDYGGDESMAMLQNESRLVFSNGLLHAPMLAVLKERYG